MPEKRETCSDQQMDSNPQASNLRIDQASLRFLNVAGGFQTKGPSRLRIFGGGSGN